MVWQDFSDLVLSYKRLGKGTYSTVMLGYDCRAGRDEAPVALKTFDFNNRPLMATRILLGMIENELNIHQAVDCPNICHPLGHGTLHARLCSSPSSTRTADRRGPFVCVAAVEMIDDQPRTVKVVFPKADGSVADLLADFGNRPLSDRTIRK